jgi:hypothetical protein
MLEHMHGAKVFSKFNLKMGYNQLCIKPEDVWKTAFMTPDGLYVMLIMTFGFANATAYFQRWMFKTLGSILHHHIENYLDDTRSHHLSMEEHVQVNQDILQRFRDAGLFANNKKCKFHWDMLQFLGVEVLQKGFEMERMKVDMIEKWQAPQNIQGVQEFVRFCNFY